jgi:hypothetical protein
MGLHTKVLPWIIPLAMAAIGLAAAPGEALWVDLRPEQIAQAVAYGRAGRDTAAEAFEREWRVAAEGGGGTATVDSEFIVLARVARELARRGNEGSLNLPEALCAFLAGPALYVALALDVARGVEGAGIEAHLEWGGRAAPPLEVWPNQLLAWEAAGGGPALARESHYLKFSLEGVDPRGRVTLVAQGAGGRTWRFPIDLAAMR